MQTNTRDFTILIGRPQNGKTTSAEFLSRATGRQFASTSGLCYEALAERWGTTVEELRARPKETIRRDLAAIGDEILDRDPKAFGVKLAQQGVTIIDGVRRRKELAAVREHLAGQGFNVRTLWIENPRVEHIADNTEVTPADADEVILNDGTIPELREKLSLTHDGMAVGVTGISHGQLTATRARRNELLARLDRIRERDMVERVGERVIG